MEKMLEALKGVYDYVILDLPPVGEVSDAMAVANQTDGILLVVRQNGCDRHALSDAVGQFKFIEAKILGVVFNCVNDHAGKGYYKHYKQYYKSRYYKKYYKGYYRRNTKKQPVSSVENVTIEE
jgi:Mrp family chromosome partitioning ATPase